MNVNLLLQAIRDWRSKRAFFRNGRFWLRTTPVTMNGVTYAVQRVQVAPWSREALAWFGTCDNLHDASQIFYPHATETAFGRMHTFDTVGSKILRSEL